MAPGDLIAPVGLSEGDLVQALDLDGFWYNAKVLQKRGRGASTAREGPVHALFGVP